MAKKKNHEYWERMWENSDDKSVRLSRMSNKYIQKCYEGYADVKYEDVWSLDIRLATIIANHLHAFLKAQKGPAGGCPDCFMNIEYGIDEAHRMWMNVIRKMIYAFEEYQNCESGSDFDDLPQEKQGRIREGMQLFIDYYRCLWI